MLGGLPANGTFLPMLFLYRPRQTWMPYRMPREPTQQAAYNRQLQASYAATRSAPLRYPGRRPIQLGLPGIRSPI
jgi:hypothetical protein